MSLEVIGQTEEEMYEQGKKLHELFRARSRSKENIVIKIPVNPSTQEKKLTYDGLKVINHLSESSIPVNATLIMTPEQSLLAAKAGAKYISPFIGRIDDYYISTKNKTKGIQLIKNTTKILRNYSTLETEIIAASIRNIQHVRESALAGAHIATIPFKVLEKMIYHPKTEEGMKSFLEDVVPEYAEIFK